MPISEWIVVILRGVNPSINRDTIPPFHSLFLPFFLCHFLTSCHEKPDLEKQLIRVEPLAVAVSPYGWLVTHYGWLAG